MRELDYSRHFKMTLPFLYLLILPFLYLIYNVLTSRTSMLIAHFSLTKPENISYNMNVSTTKQSNCK